MLHVLTSIALAFTNVQTPATVTFESLLDEMTQVCSIARLPSPSYRQMQASSYDRTQTDPTNRETWFGNADWGGYVRTEKHNGRTEWVLMEHNGPGTITRFWIPLLAEKDKAIVRFTFDGADKPSFEVN